MSILAKARVARRSGRQSQMAKFPSSVVSFARRGLVLLFLFLFPIQSSASSCVILLHGLAYYTNAMSKLETRLERSGYTVDFVEYPWRKQSPEALAQYAVGGGINRCRESGADRIDFVTHSFGGILVRLYLEEHSLDELGQVVMLSPPNRGTRLVDFLSHFPGFSLLGGPSAAALGTADVSILNELGPVNFELGVIAGSRDVNPLSWILLQGPSDGLVSVESTKVEGMDAHLVLPVIHNTMMRKDTVIDHTIHYLKTGSFMPE